MFNPVDDDDDLFVPQNSSSNLAGLFETASVTKPGNADLMYIPPKQPKRTLQLQSSTQPKSKPQNSVLFAKVVTVYKSQSDFNLRKVVGTYGLALIVLQETNTTLLQNNKDLNQKIALLESKNNSFHEDLNQKVNNLSNTIKDSMNLMYQNIVGQFEEPLLQNQMKPILSTNIKRATLDVIEKFHKCLLSPSNSNLLFENSALSAQMAVILIVPPLYYL
ncbi:hypothetical protein Trydic_g15310 [Trypoxylus dichotomus]